MGEGAAIGEDASDDQLMDRVAAGDPAAFRMLLARHDQAVGRAARSVARTPSEAEDLAQEAWSRLLAKARSWQQGGPAVAAWLTRVVTNLGIDNRRRTQPVQLDDETAAGFVDPTPDAEEQMAQHQQTLAVRAAIAALPERQRDAIGLVYRHGLSNLAAAERLGISVGALEQLLVRAKRTMRQQVASSNDR